MLLTDIVSSFEQYEYLPAFPRRESSKIKSLIVLNPTKTSSYRSRGVVSSPLWTKKMWSTRALAVSESHF